MPRLIRHTLLTVAAILAATLFTSRAEPQAPTVTVTLTFAVPFTLRNLHPEITRLSQNCTVKVGGSSYQTRATGGITPLYIPDLPKSTDGTISGTHTQAWLVTIPADAGGKQGTYECLLVGQTDAAVAANFSNGHPDPRFNVAAPDRVTGSFVW